MHALIIGFGNVGKTMARILTDERERFPGLAGLDLTPAAIVTKNHGAVANPDGIALAEAYHSYLDADGFTEHPDAARMTALEAAQTLEYDVLVELSTLSIDGRGEPALSHIRTALQRGKHAVSANKGPVAFAWSELDRIAREQRRRFLFETVVMDGAPIFNLARGCLKGCTVTEVDGIFNSTTNVILTSMEKGISFDEAVRQAQQVGIAEADPSNDIDGWDAAAKTAALANVLMDAGITPFDVEREGIAGITLEDVSAARRAGHHLKLICRARRDGEHVRAGVGVERIPQDHHFAAITGSGNILRYHTDLMAPIHVIQETPDLYDTAYGVLDDLLTLKAEEHL
ncbi:MAG: homoserine dehydrogenase [Synergistales bacterium]|nr:homoserine dehydrogenase [Synergistales bacterium]